MKLPAIASYGWDLVFRLLPHRAPTGLFEIGAPGPGAPVLLTGNYTLTVRRLRDALRDRDVWLLCANSKGINVWCAAGGGHFTHHDVISVLRTSGVAERVTHRKLVLPQLCGTGVERRAIAEATGWESRWGPARLEDLPAFLDRGQRVRKSDRFMRFPMWERMEMATVWLLPMLAIGAPLVGWLAGWAAACAGALAVAMHVLGLFALVPWLSLRGARRWLTFGASAALATGLGVAVSWLLGATDPSPLAAVALQVGISAGVLAIDFAGTTPWLPSSVNSAGNAPTIELVDERCTGAADCVLVCPRDVLAMKGAERKVEIAKPDQCIQCGACVVQCPSDALRFRYRDGRVAEASTLRKTRMNMLGRRTVRVED